MSWIIKCLKRVIDGSKKPVLESGKGKYVLLPPELIVPPPRYSLYYHFDGRMQEPLFFDGVLADSPNL